MRTLSTTVVTTFVLSVTAASAARAEVPVLVMPFADESGGSAKWVEQSIQQSLLGDVARGGAFKPVTAPAGAPSDDLATAISAARQMGAPYVVFGSYQVRGDQVHVNANAVDVERMQIIGGVQVGRPTRDMFAATDALGGHLLGQLGQARTPGSSQGPTNAIGSINRMQLPLASLPMSYVDWAAEARRKSVHDRPSQWARLLPGQLVVDYPLEKIPDRLLPPSRDPRMPFSHQIQQSDGNQITRSDGDRILGGDGNTIQRGDGNTLSFNRGADLPGNRDRGFGNSMQFNRGPRDTSVNRVTPAGTSGNSINGTAGGAVRPGAGSAVTPGSGRAVRPGNGNAVGGGSGNAVTPQNRNPR